MHAVALDEQRMPFEPTLWDASPRVTQALFPVGHCDVGGGYAEHGLSDTPLLWVVDRLQQADAGLQFTLQAPTDVTPDPRRPRHRARVAIWSGWPRVFPAGMVVNDTVRQRLEGAPENLFGTTGDQPAYAPPNLPRQAPGPAGVDSSG